MLVFAAKIGFLKPNSVRALCGVRSICCGSILSLVQILFSFVLNSLKCMTMSLKQRKIKFEPRIKLNHNIYMSGSGEDSLFFFSTFLQICTTGNSTLNEPNMFLCYFLRKKNSNSKSRRKANSSPGLIRAYGRTYVRT